MINFNRINLAISDGTRFKRWLKACNNPRIQKMDEMTVHKRYRVCRRHFDSDCLNGGCRRLLNTAVPTLYLNSSSTTTQEIENSDASENLITTPENIIYIPGAADYSEEHFELVLTENKPLIVANDAKGKLNRKFHHIFKFFGCYFNVSFQQIKSSLECKLAFTNQQEEIGRNIKGWR